MSEPAKTNDRAATARLVRRTLLQWPLILVCALVASVAAYLASHSRTPKYEASTTIQLNQIDLSSVFLQQNVQQQGDDTQSKAATNAQIVKLPRVQADTSRHLGGRVSPAQLADEVSVTPKTGTTLLVISARDRNPQLAADIANQTRESFIRIRRQSSLQQLNSATDDATKQLENLPEDQKQSAMGQSLLDRLSQLGTLRAVANGGVDTVQIAPVPTTPVSPRPKRDAILALLLGALIGTGIAALRARFDTRIREEKEFAEIWDLPVLGLIPETRDLRSDRKEIPAGPALEAFALARTNLRYLHVGGEVKTVVVTSALQGEGKSTVVWNLAVAAAMADSRVLVIEADLRLPVLAGRLGLHTQHGLSEVLAGLSTFDDAVVRARYGDSASGVDAEIDVLLAGMAPPSPIALLERRTLQEVLAAAARDYDLVLIDSPPATIVGDAKVILQQADGVVVVSRLDRATRTGFERLREILDGAGAPVLGLILNGGASGRAYGYTARVAAGNESSGGGSGLKVGGRAPSSRSREHVSA